MFLFVELSQNLRQMHEMERIKKLQLSGIELFCIFAIRLCDRYKQGRLRAFLPLYLNEN